MIFILNREGTVTETVTSPVYQGSNANEVVVLAPFAPTNTVTVGFTLPNGLIVQPKLTDSGKGTAMTSLPVKDLSLKVGETYEDMSAWYCKIDRDITRYSGTLTMQFFLYDTAGDIIASSSATVPVQKGVPVLDGTTFDASTAAQLQTALDKVYTVLVSVKETSELNGEMISTLQNVVSENTAEITVLKAQAEKTDTNITDLKDRVSANEQNIDGLLGTTAELSQLVSGLDIDTKQLKSELDALDVRMYDAEDSIIAVEDRVTENEESIINLGTRMTNAEGSIKDLKSSVSLIWTILGNTIINVTTVEDTYNTRVTAGGLPVVDEAPTTVHKITGASAASINLAKLANGTFTSNGVTFVSSSETGTVHISGSLDEGTTFASLTVSHFSLRQGTYTLYAPHKVDKVSWIVRNEQNEKVESLSWNGTDTVKSFTVSADGSYNLYIYVNGSLSTVLNYTETPMLLYGDRTASLPAFEPYYAGIKSAGFKGLLSTGRNLLHPSADTNVTSNGLTYTADASTGIVTITGTKTSENSSSSLLGSFDLPKGTYTLYLPHKIQGIGWVVKTITHVPVASLSWNTDTKFSSFTVETAGSFYLLAYVVTDGLSVNCTDTPMILPGTVTENFPAFETYHADTSFALTTPVTLGKWDHIDVDAQKMIVGTATLTQETPFTDEQLAQYADYVLSADGKTIAYESATTTRTAVTLPKTYKAWRGGCEYITADASGGQNPDNVKITVNQDYYEEVSNA